jgi:trigger factor
MEINVQKNNVELIIEAKYSKVELEKNIQTLAKELAKTVKLPGFRAGKVPLKAVLKFYKDKLNQEAEEKIFKNILNIGLNNEKIDPTNILGDVLLIDKNKTENSFDVKLKAYLRPVVKISDDIFEKLPEIKKEEVSDDEVNERIKLMIKDHKQSEFQETNIGKPLKFGNTAILNIESFIDGKSFEDLRFNEYVLELGKNQFLPNFDDKLVGLKVGDTAEITITLPENCKYEKVRGKEAIIKCEITNIALNIEDIELNDEIAKDLLKENEIDSSLSPIENLKKVVKKQLEEIKLNDQISNEELHEKVREILLNTIQFEVPENIVEEEMQLWIKREVENMSDEERKKLEENEEEISKLYNRLIDNVVDSVRLTFIIDELAKREKITITDKQVFDFIFYQAVFEQTDPQNMINELRNNRNMFLLLKMKLVELEVINSLLKKRVK